MTIPELTATEKLVVLHVARGSSTRAIADELGVATRTVEWHLARARQKLERTAALHERVQGVRDDRDADLEGGTR